MLDFGESNSFSGEYQELVSGERLRPTFASRCCTVGAEAVAGILFVICTKVIYNYVNQIRVIRT